MDEYKEVITIPSNEEWKRHIYDESGYLIGQICEKPKKDDRVENKKSGLVSTIEMKGL